ncbi:hypothetical protein AUQ42_03615 [Thalassospira sp. MCCC 1A02491]|nr:hypothetical protein AUQ42_03615 [Thalassospira sp. MCCC 1A02491]
MSSGGVVMTKDQNHEIRLLAYLVPKPGKREKLLAEIQAIVEQTKSEEGCLEYAPHELIGSFGTIVMDERWLNQSCLDAHAKSRHFKNLAEQFDELLAEPLKLHFLEPLAS